MTSEVYRIEAYDRYGLMVELIKCVRKIVKKYNKMDATRITIEIQKSPEYEISESESSVSGTSEEMDEDTSDDEEGMIEEFCDMDDESLMGSIARLRYYNRIRKE